MTKNTIKGRGLQSRLTRRRADGFTLYWSLRNMPWKLTFVSPPVGFYLSPTLSTVASGGGGRNGPGEGRLVRSTRRVALTHRVPGLNAIGQAFTTGRSAHRSQMGAQFLYIFISSVIIITVLHAHTFGYMPPLPTRKKTSLHYLFNDGGGGGGHGKRSMAVARGNA